MQFPNAAGAGHITIGPELLAQQPGIIGTAAKGLTELQRVVGRGF